MFNRDVMLDALRNEVCEVVFTKKNGEERVLKATLVDAKIPAEYAPKGTGPAYTDAVIRAFDVEKEAWRSFTVANVISFNGNVD